MALGQNGRVCPLNEHWMLIWVNFAHKMFGKMAE